MKHAVLDIGTNSVKLLVGRFTAGDLAPEFELAQVTRLGEGLHAHGVLGDEAMRRTREAIEAFVHEARARDVDSIVAVGTLALRRAGNADRFLTDVKSSTGIEVEVIAGEEEARLSFLAATSVVTTGGRVCMFDIGGGSTELVYGHGRVVESRRSVELGARVSTDRFVRHDPPRSEDIRALRGWLDAEFGELDAAIDGAVGVGGTITTLAAVALGIERFDERSQPGYRLDLDEVQRQIERFASLPLDRRQQIRGLVPERADVILAGACVVETLLQKLKKPAVMVSHRGLRHGVFLDRFGAAGSS